MHSAEDTRPSWKSTSASSHSLVLANNFRGHYQIVKDQNKTPGCISAQRQCLPGIVHSRDGSASVNMPGQKFFGQHTRRIIQSGLRERALPSSHPLERGAGQKVDPFRACRVCQPTSGRTEISFRNSGEMSRPHQEQTALPFPATANPLQVLQPHPDRVARTLQVCTSRATAPTLRNIRRLCPLTYID
jgi:hypothetical protein